MRANVMKPHHTHHKGGEKKKADDPAHEDEHGTPQNGLKPELQATNKNGPAHA
jgi:hypothetical protein